MNSGKKLAPVVSVLNMKGGVGKTTISAHLFHHIFARLQRSTLLVDFDPQFNLSQTVLTRSRYDAQKQAGKTIMSVMEGAPSTSLFNVTNQLGPPPNESEVITPLKYFRGTETKLSLVAGDFGLAKYSLIEDQKSLQGVRARFLKFIENSRQTRDLICIDCNPSSSFMTLCALMASTHILVPVRPDRYSILGLELLEEFVNGLSILTKKPKMIVLLNGIPTIGYDNSVETSLRGNPKFGPLTLANTLKISGLLEAKTAYTGFATDKKVAHRTTLESRLSRIVDELKGPLGL